MDMETSNDNDGLPRAERLRRNDAHGQVAMLLVESLIHGLIARSVIEVADAVEIVEIAAEIKKEIAVEAGDSPDATQQSLAILDTLRASLQIDLPAR